jgi:uncharacterized protein (TIGR02246 family)
VNHESFQRWLDDYVEAWRSNDPEMIEALFSEDAVYYRSAYSNPVRGRDAITALWLRVKDEPGTWTADYRPVAVEGDVAVGTGVTRYYADSSRTSLADEYSNVFIVRFDQSGRCSEYREWWMQRAKPSDG